MRNETIGNRTIKGLLTMYTKWRYTLNHLDMVEVTGSNPVGFTTHKPCG